MSTEYFGPDLVTIAKLLCNVHGMQIVLFMVSAS